MNRIESHLTLQFFKLSISVILLKMLLENLLTCKLREKLEAYRDVFNADERKNETRKNGRLFRYGKYYKDAM